MCATWSQVSDQDAIAAPNSGGARSRSLLGVNGQGKEIKLVHAGIVDRLKALRNSRVTQTQAMHRLPLSAVGADHPLRRLCDNMERIVTQPVEGMFRTLVT